jgi:Spy/CpxP family protein refolding chaperone
VFILLLWRKEDFMKKIIVLGLALLVSGGVVAQDHKMAGGHKQHMMQELNLTEQQKAQMKALHEKSMAEHKAIQDKHDAEVKSILTPEQYEKYKVKRDERRSRMMERMQKHKEMKADKNMAADEAPAK